MKIKKISFLFLLVLTLFLTLFINVALTKKLVEEENQIDPSEDYIYAEEGYDYPPFKTNSELNHAIKKANHKMDAKKKDHMKDEDDDYRSLRKTFPDVGYAVHQCPFEYTLKKSYPGKDFRNDLYDYDEDDDEPIIIDCLDRLCDCSRMGPASITCNNILFDDDMHLTSAHIEFKHLDNDTEYRIIRLRHNAIKDIKKGELFTNDEIKASVVDIDLSYNRIERIEAKSFDEFKKLTALKLGHNRLNLKTLKNVFTPYLNSLELLELDYNTHIKTIPLGFFDELVNLKQLTLDGNQLKGLSSRTFNLPNLERLSMDDCGIKDLPDDFFDNLPKLTVLSLRNNEFLMVPLAISKIRGLTVLDLSNNDIAEITRDSFESLTIESIRMDNCSYLYEIDNCAFCDTPNLKMLSLNNCTQLYFIDQNAFGSIYPNEFGYGTPRNVPILEQFHCENCSLTTLDQNLLDWEKLRLTSFGNIKLICDDSLTWICHTLSFLHTFVGRPPICVEPKDLKNMSLKQFCQKVEKKENKSIDFGNLVHNIKIQILFFVLVLTTFLFISMIVCFVYCHAKKRGVVGKPKWPKETDMDDTHLVINPLFDVKDDGGEHDNMI